MNEGIEKNTAQNKRLLLIISLLIIVIIIMLSIIIYLLTKSDSDNKEYSNNNIPTTIKPTMKLHEITKNPDYEESMCGTQYFFGELMLKDNTLYAVIDENNEYTKDISTTSVDGKKVYKLMDNIKKAFFSENGQCGYNFAFASGIDVQFYYINNFNISLQEKLSVTLVEELKNIDRLESREVDGAINSFAIDSNGKEYEMSKIIDKYSKLEY